MKKINVDIIGSDCAGFGVTAEQTRGILHLETPKLSDLSDTLVNLIAVEGERTGRMIVKKGENYGEYTAQRTKVVALIEVDGKIKESGAMFSGQFVIASDSRFPYDSPVPCHTRVE